MLIKSNIWIRFTVVFFIHIVVKSFDLSFPDGPFALDFRSLIFSVCFIGYGLIIWKFAEWFDKKMRKIIINPEGGKGKSALLTIAHGAFAFILMFALNHFYRLGDTYIFGNGHLWEHISYLNPELVISMSIFYLLIFGFDNYSKIHQKLQENLLKKEQLKKENITAQYRALKAQIEPHFLFNSLSVLSSLVYEDADLSADFIVKLSKTLRYIIEKNEFYLVRLSEEFEFLDAYFFLVKTRLNEGVFLENKLNREVLENTYIPPVTLQLLVENAVSHNTYNPRNPLQIYIEKEPGFIVVRNNLNPRFPLEKSTRQGLKNIKKRYDLISEKKVEIIKTDTEFIVKIPILNQADYERINI